MDWAKIDAERRDLAGYAPADLESGLTRGGGTPVIPYAELLREAKWTRAQHLAAHESYLRAEARANYLAERSGMY